MSSPPGPSAIVNPSPATGLRVGTPRCQVWIDGRQLFTYLEVTGTRGLDQPMATADILVPDPLPDWVKFWSKVQIVAGIPPANASIGQVGMVTRFTGYVRGLNNTLYPPGKVIHCEDILSIAANKFTPEEMDLGSFLDSQAVREVLHGCGYHESTFQTINGLTSGTGTFLVDVEEAQLFWELGETGLEKIQDIDSISLGWRTYATAGGIITRRQIVIDPNTVNYVWHFAEGVDILEGSTTVEQEDPKNEITVTGFDGSITVTLDPEDDPFDWNRNTYWIRYQQLRTQAFATGTINPQDIALYILAHISKPIIKITFTTHLDIHFQGQEVIKVTSEKLEVTQNFWVQSVQFNVQPDGSWSQTITGISHLQPYNRHMVVPPIDPTDSDVTAGDDIPYPELPAPIEPAPEDFLLDFTIEAIDQEFGGDPANTADTGGARYVVMATDTTTNTGLLSYNRAWSAAGPGLVGPASGSWGPFLTSFTTYFNDLTDATITFTADPGGPNEASLTQEISEVASVIRSRKLYALTEDTYEAYDGTQWRALAPVAPSKVQCVGGGPVWGADHYVAISADELATAPTEVAALPPGEDVTCIWLHEVNNLLLGVGGANGSVAISSDGGATWVQKTPADSAVRQIIISINLENEVHIVTETGWYISHDQGDSWELVRGGDFTYLELSHTRNIVVTSAGVLERAEDGTPFTGNTSNIVAATAHIRADAFYAIAADGTTWITEVEGSYALIAGEPIPDGEVLPGGAYRDGQVVDVVYFAAQDGGIFKTVDGFKSAEGYMRLRYPGRLTP